MCLLGLNSNSRISIHAPREGGDKVGLSIVQK